MGAHALDNRTHSRSGEELGVLEPIPALEAVVLYISRGVQAGNNHM